MQHFSCKILSALMVEEMDPNIGSMLLFINSCLLLVSGVGTQKVAMQQGAM